MRGKIGDSICWSETDANDYTNLFNFFLFVLVKLFSTWTTNGSWQSKFINTTLFKLKIELFKIYILTAYQDYYYIIVVLSQFPCYMALLDWVQNSYALTHDGLTYQSASFSKTITPVNFESHFLISFRFATNVFIFVEIDFFRIQITSKAWTIGKNLFFFWKTMQFWEREGEGKHKRKRNSYWIGIFIGI